MPLAEADEVWVWGMDMDVRTSGDKRGTHVSSSLGMPLTLRSRQTLLRMSFGCTAPRVTQVVFLFFIMAQAAAQGMSTKGDRDMMMKIGTVLMSLSINDQEAESINWPSSMMRIILSSFTVCTRWRNRKMPWGFGFSYSRMWICMYIH